MRIGDSIKDLRSLFREHRKTFRTAGIVLLGALLFTLLLVLPRTSRVVRLQHEIDLLKQRIGQVVPVGADARLLEQIIAQNQRDLSRLEGGLPQQERVSEVLKNLSQRATELGVTVVSLRAQPSRPYPNPEAPLRVEGRVCHVLPIQMQIECPYRTLGKYLESLTENFPLVVTVDDLEVQRDEGKVPNLKVSLLITSYVFESP